ncbi:hypothetical protein EVAR_40073_1 [Eumeta japonica]|uniref:Uncharacterized protein n=1 Tax=Eumeta variegata TaxID=151549 RepID=A0A4C1X5Q4_EUMVA|nr:hypothetical protein EVAR_40073_1 [Eumeta japonica]
MGPRCGCIMKMRRLDGNPLFLKDRQRTGYLELLVHGRTVITLLPSGSHCSLKCNKNVLEFYVRLSNRPTNEAHPPMNFLYQVEGQRYKHPSLARCGSGAADAFDINRMTI